MIRHLALALAAATPAAPVLGQVETIAPIDAPVRHGRGCWLGLFIERRGGLTIETPEHRTERLTMRTLGGYIRRGDPDCDENIWLVDAAPRTPQRTMKAVIEIVGANLSEGDAVRLPPAYRSDDRGVPTPIVPAGR